MSSAYNHPIDRARHQARLRAALEGYDALSPALPFERPRRLVDPRTGGVRVLTAGGFYVAID